MSTNIAQRAYTVTNPALGISFEVRAQSINHALHVAETTWKFDPRSKEYPDAMRDGYKMVWLDVN